MTETSFASRVLHFVRNCAACLDNIVPLFFKEGEGGRRSSGYSSARMLSTYLSTSDLADTLNQDNMFSINSSASMVKIYFTSQHINKALVVEKIFIEKYSIPERIIEVKRVTDCFSQDKRFLELCINRKGELKRFSNSNIFKIKKSLLVFSQQRSKDEEN